MDTNDANDCPGRIYLLAQNRLVREVLVRMLRKRLDLTVAGVNEDSTRAIEELAGIPLDVLLLDSLETVQTIRQTPEVAARLKTVKIVLFGVEEDQKNFLQAVHLGVSGYLPKDTSSAQMITALKSVMQGEVVCPPKFCKWLFEHVARDHPPETGKPGQAEKPINDLTCRQRQLMALVAKGMTNKEIAANLRLSEFTVKNHLRRIMAHLGAASRHQAVDVIRTGGLFLNG